MKREQRRREKYQTQPVDQPISINYQYTPTHMVISFTGGVYPALTLTEHPALTLTEHQAHEMIAALETTLAAFQKYQREQVSGAGSEPVGLTPPTTTH